MDEVYARSLPAMETRSLDTAEPFTTKDGSTIRELFGLPTGGTKLQSLAEARLPPGGRTQRHYHADTEEIYFVTGGRGEMELDGERTPSWAGRDGRHPAPRLARDHRARR